MNVPATRTAVTLMPTVRTPKDPTIAPANHHIMETGNIAYISVSFTCNHWPLSHCIRLIHADELGQVNYSETFLCIIRFVYTYYD